MAKIRDDFEGVTFIFTPDGVALPPLAAGDEIPDGVTVGDHLLASAESAAPEPVAQVPELPADTETMQPPKGNGSREDWAAYADSLGVAYDADAKRDEIRDLVNESQKD